MRLSRASAVLVLTASCIVGAASSGAGAAPPNHGVDKNGYCTPKYVGNTDCYHYTETLYSPPTCRELIEELNMYSVARCVSVPPDGKQKVWTYTTACKQSESVERCRKRLGTKPTVMQPGHW